MAIASACPDHDKLRQLVHGGLPKGEEEALESHLLACGSCFAAARELEAADTLLQCGGQATTLPDDDDAPMEEQIRELVSRLKSLQPQRTSVSRSDPWKTAAEAPGGPAPGADRALYDFLAPPQAEHELGRLGQYRVLQVLGAGGMGVVFLAEDLHLERRVALKAMLPALAASASAKQRFVREARSAAALKHDHVVTIHQVGEDQGVPFLAMELLEGESLDDRLKRERQLPPAEVMRIGRETALGLAAAHARGLIHRDIKPANIWLEAPTGRVKILDFGLARNEREAAHLTASGTIMGTPAYMAPEQGRGLPVDHRADLFSLGCVLYQMLTGKRPFTGSDTMAVLTSLAIDTPPAPHAINPHCPPALSQLTMHLLAKQPEQRPASAKVVADALGQIEASAVAATAVVAAPDPWADIDASDGTEQLASPAEPTLTPKPMPRRRRPLAFVAFGLLAAFIGVGVFFGGTIVRIVTNQGELIIEVDDPNVEVKIVQNGVVVEDKTAKRQFTLTAGKGEIEVLEKDGIKLTTKQFELTRNGKTTVRVTLQELADARKPKDPLGGDPKGSAQADADRRAAEWVLSISGTVRVNGEERVRKTVAELPKESFRLTNIYLLDNKQVSDTGLAHVQDCKNLTSLDLNGTPVSDAGLAPFKNCKNLTHLDLNNTKVGDTGLANFKDCKDLAFLELGNTKVSDAGLAHFKNLTYLELSSTQVSDAGLAHFKDGKNLTHLHLGATQVSDAGLVHFKDCKLTQLSLSVTQVSDAGLVHFKDFKNLTYLHLGSTKVSDAGLALFKDCEALTKLSLGSTKVSDAGLAHFKNCKNLTYLHLNNMLVSDAGLAHFKECKNLTILNLGRTKVTAAGIDELKKALPQCKIDSDHGTFEPKVATDSDRRAAEWVLGCGGKVLYGGGVWVTAAKELPAGPFFLIHVNLDGCGDKVTDAGLERLKGLTRLTNLNLARTPVTDSGLEHVKELVTLVDLRLGRTRVTDAGLEHLKGLKRLTNLSVHNTNVTDAGLEHLRGLDQLQDLDLSGTPVTHAGVKHLKGLTGLTVLDLSWSPVTDAALEHLMALRQLTQLTLSRTQVTDAGLEKLKGFTALTCLDVGGPESPLTNAGVEHLKGMTKLTHLNVSGPHVTDAGLAHLKGLDKLTGLGLGGSGLTDAGLEHLKGLANLAELHLHQTKVTPAGAEKLRQTLPNCKVVFD